MQTGALWWEVPPARNSGLVLRIAVTAQLILGGREEGGWCGRKWTPGSAHSSFPLISCQPLSLAKPNGRQRTNELEWCYPECSLPGNKMGPSGDGSTDTNEGHPAQWASLHGNANAVTFTALMTRSFQRTVERRHWLKTDLLVFSHPPTCVFIRVHSAPPHFIQESHVQCIKNVGGNFKHHFKPRTQRCQQGL